MPTDHGLYSPTALSLFTTHPDTARSRICCSQDSIPHRFHLSHQSLFPSFPLLLSFFLFHVLPSVHNYINICYCYLLWFSLLLPLFYLPMICATRGGFIVTTHQLLSQVLFRAAHPNFSKVVHRTNPSTNMDCCFLF